MMTLVVGFTSFPSSLSNSSTEIVDQHHSLNLINMAFAASDKECPPGNCAPGRFPSPLPELPGPVPAPRGQESLRPYYLERSQPVSGYRIFAARGENSRCPPLLFTIINHTSPLPWSFLTEKPRGQSREGGKLGPKIGCLAALHPCAANRQ